MRIRRIIESYEEGTIKPQFEVYDNSIVVILPALTQEAKVSTDGEKVLEVLKGGRILSSREIAGSHGWSKDKAIRILNLLISEGYVKQIGSGRGTKYSLS